MFRFLAVFTAVMFTGAALAAVAEPSPLAFQLQQLIDWGINAAVTAIVGLVVLAGQKLFGMTVQAVHRSALHRALTSGAYLAIATIADLLRQGFSREEAYNTALKLAFDYTKESVPGALAALKPTDDFLLKMQKAKLEETRLGKPPPAFVVDVQPPAIGEIVTGATSPAGTVKIDVQVPERTGTVKR